MVQAAWAVIDDIDALVDEQMAQFENRTGWDQSNRATVPKCRCGEDFHGLPITEHMRSMQSNGYLEPGYVYAEDTSRILCPGTEVEGPLWQPPSIVHHTNEVSGVDSWVDFQMGEAGDRCAMVMVGTTRFRKIQRLLRRASEHGSTATARLDARTVLADLTEAYADVQAGMYQPAEVVGSIPADVATAIGFRRHLEGDVADIAVRFFEHSPFESVASESRQERRERSMTPQQAEALLNSSFLSGPSEFEGLLGQMRTDPSVPRGRVLLTSSPARESGAMAALQTRRMRVDERPRREGEWFSTPEWDSDGNWTEPWFQRASVADLDARSPMPIYTVRVHPADNITGVRFHRSPPRVRHGEVLAQYVLNACGVLDPPSISQREGRSPAWKEQRRLWWRMWLEDLQEQAFRGPFPPVVEFVGLGSVTIWQAIDIAALHAGQDMMVPQAVCRDPDTDVWQVHWPRSSRLRMAGEFAQWLGFEILRPSVHSPSAQELPQWQRRVGRQVYGAAFHYQPDQGRGDDVYRIDDRQRAELAAFERSRQPRCR